MKVLRSSSAPGIPQLQASAVTIGNFDGCHRGHQVLIAKSISLAETHGFCSLCLTFDPNPKQFFRPDRSIGKLFQPRQKLRALAELGVDYVVIQRFDQAFSILSPEQFYENLLHRDLGARAIVVGQDFRFGRNREGTLDILTTLAKAHDCLIAPIEPQVWNEHVVSSSSIRQALVERDLAKAESLLGRPYLLEGQVVGGQKLGRQLGFPTANVATQDQLLPGFGVYAGYAVVDPEPPIFTLPAQRKPCVLNIGKRPTVSGGEPVISTEVHILSSDIGTDALYDQTLGVYLTHFIRPEQRFPSIEVLKAQIAIDCQQARRLLSAGA